MLRSSIISRSPSISEPSLLLVLPSEPVEDTDVVDSLPLTFGLASGVDLLKIEPSCP